MGLIAVATGGRDFELCPAGNHIARCYAVVDLGMQVVNWQGEDKWLHKVRISWELPGEIMEDGRPFSVTKNYTLSLHEKSNLRKDLQSWRGKSFTDEELAGFDLFTILGVPALVNVVHNESNGRIYANIEAVSPVPKGMEAPVLINDPLKFSLTEFDQDVFDSFPDWLKGKINLRGVQAPVSNTERVLVDGLPGTADAVYADVKFEGRTTNYQDSGVPANYDERNPPADFDDDIPF